MWSPCWPHEPCYQGYQRVRIPVAMVQRHHSVTRSPGNTCLISVSFCVRGLMDAYYCGIAINCTRFDVCRIHDGTLQMMCSPAALWYLGNGVYLINLTELLLRHTPSLIHLTSSITTCCHRVPMTTPRGLTLLSGFLTIFRIISCGYPGLGKSCHFLVFNIDKMTAW